MQSIFENANKPFNIFSFFCSLIGTINNQTKEWHMSQDEMISLWGYGKETINGYLEQLEKMQLIYVYRHKKRRSNGTYYKLNNSYGRYCDKDAVIAEVQKYSDTVECEDFVEKLDRRAIKLRYNAYCNDAKKYRNNFDAEVDLCRQVLSEPTLTSIDCVGQNDPCKVVSPKNLETPKRDIEVYKTGDYKEPDYIEVDNESHGECNHELFCITGKDLDLIDIEDLF